MPQASFPMRICTISPVFTATKTPLPTPSTTATTPVILPQTPSRVLSAIQAGTYTPTDAIIRAKPLVIDAEISHEKQFLQLTGTLATAVKGVCSRCLKPVETPVECSFAEQLLYAKDISLFSHLAVGEVEEKYFIYDNDTLDITDIVRESILAELPLKILCVEDCRGLCPKCGKNLNQGQCDCDLHEVDPRLAILATLMED